MGCYEEISPYVACSTRSHKADNRSCERLQKWKESTETYRLKIGVEPMEGGGEIKLNVAGFFELFGSYEI